MGLFDDVLGGDSQGQQSTSGLFDDVIGKPKKQNKGIAGDLVTDLKRGVEQLPGIATGLADIPVAAITGKALVGDAADALGGITGFAPAKWAKEAEAEYSPGRQAARQNVGQAWDQNKTPFSDAAGGDFSGLGNIAKAYIQNPQQLVGSVVESLPSMAVGAKGGQMLTKAAGLAAPVLSASVGEGAVMAGQQMDQLSHTDADPRAAAAASALTGIAGGALSALGGKLSQKIGFIDPDVAMAGGSLRGVTDEAKDKTIKGMVKDGAKRVAGGAVSEGAFEELPQSVLEQVLSNLAQSKPWDEGVSRAAVEGTLAGALMGGAFNVIPPKKQEAGAVPPAAEAPADEAQRLALPAPTYTGTPGDQIIASDSERQAAIDKAQAESDAIWAARDEYERQQAEYRKQPVPTIINDPEPIQQRIDALMGINAARLQGVARSNYEKALENAFNEQVGFVVGKDGKEEPFTMGDYLKSKVAAADIDRKNAAQQPAPAIPVVGPLSAAANLAVQSGAHAAHVAQQQAAIQNSQAEASSTKPGKADTPTTGNREAAPQAGILAGIAAQAPSVAPAAPNTQPQGEGGTPATAQQAGPAAASPAEVETLAADIDRRTNEQLSYLAQHGNTTEKRSEAAAELQRRGVQVSTEQQAKQDDGFIRLAAYNIVNADPLKPDDLPLSADDAVFEIETLQDRAARGRLTTHAFVQSAIASRLDTAQVMRINEQINAGDFSFLGKLKERISASVPALSEGKPVPANVLADYPDLKAAAVDAVSQPKTDASTEAKQGKPFDSKAWDKERDNRIKESKGAGNTHLDQVAPSVESMRGKEIYYVHNPKQRGVIRTVDNRGNVYVHWSDEYSAEKELASKTIEDNKSWLKSSKDMPILRVVRDGKTYVMESSLGASDLKDYVFATKAAPAAVDAKKEAETKKEETFKPGDIVSFKGGKAETVESIGADGWVYTRGGAAGPASDFAPAKHEEPPAYSWGDLVQNGHEGTKQDKKVASGKPEGGKSDTVPDADTRFAKNTIFTADKVAAAKARMKAKLGTLNSGIDPELLIDGMTIAGAYIESGVRKFADYAKAMVEDLGDGVKPYLLSFYEAARAYPGLNKLGMDSAESAAAQHQAMLTPEVKAAAKEVIGESPKVEKKKPANLGEALRLKADWGVPNIDGYAKSKTGKNQETDSGLKGGVKDEFLADAKRYLKAVAKLLEDQGFETHVDNRGKVIAAVNSNKGGPDVGGDVYLSMRQGDFGVYAQVGVTNVRGIGPAHPQGVSLMVRVTPQAKSDRAATKGMNNWLSTDLNAGELAAWFKQRMTVANQAASTKLEVKNEQSAPTSAPNNGEANNGTATSQQGNPVLAGMAPESVQGTAGSESTGNGGGSSGGRSGEGNQGTDAGRRPSGRSGGSGTAEVDSSDAGGTRSGRAGLGNSGTGGQGSGVSKPASKPGQSGAGRESSVPAVSEPAPAAPTIPEANFEITEEVALGSGGQMTKYRDNVAAIKVLKTIEAERRRATAAEKKILARYVGWGGIPNAFRNGVTGQVAKDWEAEVAELESLLTPKELRAASASTRNAHYTAKEVVDFMWGAVSKMGFDGGLVLEPSVGTGNFIGLMPKEFSGRSFVTGVELDSLTSRIASALYPKSAIVNTGFQNAALPSNRFRLVIGNPPFGAESLRFQYRPELNGASIHNQFFLGSMDSLEPGGLMTMVVSRYLLDAKDATSREKLAIDAELLGAIRLPGSAFKGNALTEVVTDVLFLRKRSPEDAQTLREAYFKRGKPIKGKDSKVIYELQAEQQRLEQQLRWTKTGEMKDPLGGEPMVVSQYFIDRPSQIVGTMDRSGSMRQGGDIEVKLAKGEKLSDRLDAILAKMNSLPAQSMTSEALSNAEKFHTAMGQSLKLSASGAEADAITFDEDGDLSTVIERVGTSGETALSVLKISPATPWSTQLQMDIDGKWFREVDKLGKDGKPEKAVKNGKATNRNVKVREVFKKESDIPKGLLLGETAFAKMKELISMRDLMVNQIDLEVGRAAPEKMEANRAELRNAYRAFTDKYGFISDQKNASIISDMPDEGLLMSLEMSYKPEVTAAKAKNTGMPAAPASAKPAAILSRPVAIPPVAKEVADSPVDGLAISLSETGRVDITRIAELRGLSEAEAMEELTGGDSPLVFKDPENGNELVEKNSYLSGNVRRKLEAAKQANLTANVKALEAVQPEPWSSDKVTARAGSNWIPAEVYGQFIAELLGDKASVQYSKLTNTFEVTGNGDSAAATATWGTRRVSAIDLFQDILNSRSTRVVDRDSEGRAIFNQVETDAANDKRREIVEQFDNWIFKDADRRIELTRIFNDIFNTRVTPQYDGSHLAFPGKVPNEIIALRRGQVNAVWRGIIDDAVLYDHAVGAGKTFTGIARAMERRRMGMSKKPMIVVPNHMVGEWAAQAYRLYPGARVLAATKKDLEAKNRRRLFAKIASGDWDMVIVPHSSFQFIAISPETEERLLMEELAIANAALADAEKAAEPGSRFKPLSVKAAEALIEKIEKRLEMARGRLGKDKLLTFEKMGVDDLTVDEAHEFKNLFYSSNLTDVRGMGNKQGSDKAFDLYSKTRVIREMNGSLAFLTGTPISNSAVEAYNILRYLAPEALKESGLEHFDAFRSQYVDATAKFEPTDSGGGLKLVTRLGRSWSNMRSLMELYYSVADVVTNDDIKRWYAEDNPGQEFPLPKVKTGDRVPVSVQATPTQMRLLQETIAAFDGLESIDDVKERNAERLRLMDRARKLSLHAKAVDPSLEDEPGGKLDKVAEKAAEIHRKWTADKGTQLIFLDRGVPKAKGDDKIIKEYDELTAKLRQASLADNEEEARKLVTRLEKFDPNEIEELRAAQNSNWSGYQHIKDRLIEQGVPANEIAFVQDFNGDAAKEQLFQAVRDGAIRILIGSTPRMGAGTNVQERLVALHHVDATWKPSDIEQREGRIIRQGNALLEKYGKDFEVEIFAYVTERTVDAKLWDLNATKLRMINAIRYYDGQFEMDFDDEAAVGMAEIAAIASGDPLLLERFKLSTEIDNLYRAKRSHRRRIESAEDGLRAAKRLVENASKEMAESKENAELRAAFTKTTNAAAAERSVKVFDKTYSFADATRLNMDYTKFVDGIGEDEKFSLMVDGKEYTSKAVAEDALRDALGDTEAFVAEVDGKKITRRSEFARAIREKVGTEFEEGQEVAATPVGTIGGIPVSVEIDNRYGGPSIYLGLTGKFESTGRRRSVVGHRYITPEKHKKGEPIPLTVNGLRAVIADFEKSVGFLWDGSDRIKESADKAQREIPAFEAQIAEKFKGQDELDAKSERLATVEAELSGRSASVDLPAGRYNVTDDQGNTTERDLSADDIKQIQSHGWKVEPIAAAGNIAAPGSMSPADKAIYGMAAEGKSAAEVLKFIATASRNPFYRQLAKLLMKTGIAPSITVGDGKNWKMNAGDGYKYAAAYNPKSNTVALFRAASAERNILHEMMHAATLKALAGKGMAAAQMQALYNHVKKTGKLAGMYGMTDIDEFVAEAFSNPKFQDRLKAIAAPQASAGWLSNAWNWFVRVVRGILGLKQGQENALSLALEIGVDVMRENMNAGEAGGDTRYATGPKQAETEAFRKWFGDSKVVDADGKPLVVYHGTNADFTSFDAARLGEKTGGADALGGFFFAENPDAADQFTWANGEKSGSIMPVYLAIKKPARGVTRLDGSNGRAAAREIEAAKAAGHDGIVFDSDMLGNNGDTWVAFRPEQIKSAIGNNGSFDGANPDIRYNIGGRAVDRDDAPKLSVDVPNESWLNEQIDYAKSRGPNRFGVPYMGKQTARFDGTIRVPVRVLSALKGESGEQGSVRANALSAIKEIMRVTGKLPLSKNGTEYLPYIEVAHDGSAWVSEGNHRIMAAAALGWQDLPVEIRYFDGGERKNGVLNPDKLLSEQIKSATDNNGQFDPTNPSIRYSANEAYIDVQNKLNSSIPLPVVLKKLGSAGMSKIVASTDMMGYSLTRDEAREAYESTIAYLKKSGIQEVDFYHVTDAGQDGFKEVGIRGSSLDYVGRSDGNLRSSSVYGYLDPRDIEKSSDGVLGSTKETPNVVHVKIPVDEIIGLRWDSNFNISYGTYSAVRLEGNVNPEWIQSVQPYSHPNEPSASAGSDAGIRYSANEAYSESYDLPEERNGNRHLDGSELEALRRAAARLEDPERGVTFRVTQDGKAIVTGPARFNIPERFKRFAEKHGLTFRAERGSARLHPNGAPERTRIGAMPEDYRGSGALYAQEMGANIDRTDRVRFNVEDDGWEVSEPSKMDAVIYALQDKHIDTKRVIQAIAGAGRAIRDAFNPYLQEELFHGRAAKGVKDFLDFELRPLLKQMQEAKVDMGDFEEYLWNRHAEERNKQIAKINPDMPDGGSGIKTADARAYLAGLPGEQKRVFESLAAKVDAINRNSQAILVGSGLENQAKIDAENAAYKHYVPLHREDMETGFASGTGKGFSVRGSSTKRAMGSGRKVVDILANITMQRERNIVRAEKNRVSNALAGLVAENPNPDFWHLDKAPKERVVEEVAIYTVLDDQGRKVEEFTSMDEAERFARSVPGSDIEQTWGDRVKERVVPGFKNRDNVLLTRINGDDHFIVFNERDERAMRMVTALKNLDVDNLGRVLSVVGKATRYLASINTQYNPVFGVINLIRDAQGALINLSSTPLAGEQKRVLGYTKDALVGIYRDIRAHRAGLVPSSNWAALFEEFQKEGGKTGYRDQYANAEARAEAIQSELAQFKEGKAKQLTRGLFGWLSDYNETMENAVRLAAYKVAKEKGMSKQQAASLAKNITVNFNRKGQMATQVGALYAFFNASVQGTARIAQALFDMKDGDIRTARLSSTGKKIVLGGIMLGTMQALLLAAAGYDDDEPPDFVKERNLVLPIGGGKYLTLAMPLGFHVLPGIGRLATEFVMSGGKDPLKKLAAFGSMFAEAFNPVGNSGFSLQTITPSVVDPFAALAENKDFTGKEIYREDFNKLNPTPGHARAKDVASVWSRYISEALNFITGGTEFKPGLFSPSPDSIDYLIGQLAGGVGRETSKAFQTGSAISTGEDLPLYKIPLVGRFIGDTEGQSGQSAKFYDAIKQINMHEAQYKGLLKDGRSAEAREYLAENPAVRLMMAGNHAELTIRKLRTMKRDLVEKDADKDQIRAIDERITATMQKFNERAGAAI